LNDATIIEKLDLKPRFIFTVFTATYNRAHTLSRVYESLKAQTFCDFEWVVGDDGSTDNTASLIKEWQIDAGFPIHYFKQVHAGKHFVYNRAVREASGEYFLEVDSDDAIKSQALERAHYHWEQIPALERNKYFAILFFCEDEEGVRFGNHFPHDPMDFDYRTFNYSKIYRSEKLRCIRTATLKQYPFSESVQDSYIPESVVFCEIGKKYKARFSNEVLRIYYQDVPSIMRKPIHPMRNLDGLRFAILYTLNNDLDFFFQRPLDFIRKAMNFARFSMHFRISIAQQYLSLNGMWSKLLWLIMIPFAVAVFCFDIVRGNTPKAAKSAREATLIDPA
jgi:glycosyltransferase involved in cell wall biosynthesis